MIGYLIFSKADNIDVHFLLLQLFGDLHQLLLVCFDGGSDESNDPDLEQTKDYIRIVLATLLTGQKENFAPYDCSGPQI